MTKLLITLAAAAGLALGSAGGGLIGHWRGHRAGVEAERAEQASAALETMIERQAAFLSDLEANRQAGEDLITRQEAVTRAMGGHNARLQSLYQTGAVRCVTDPDVHGVLGDANRDIAAAIDRAAGRLPADRP